jgi:hypothetical protein
MRDPTKPEASRTAELWPIGIIRSELRSVDDAPKQGTEGAPDAWLEISPWASSGLAGLAVGDARGQGGSLPP